VRQDPTNTIETRQRSGTVPKWEDRLGVRLAEFADVFLGHGSHYAGDQLELVQRVLPWKESPSFQELRHDAASAPDINGGAVGIRHHQLRGAIPPRHHIGRQFHRLRTEEHAQPSGALRESMRLVGSQAGRLASKPDQ